MSKSTNGIRKAGLASLAVTLTLGAGLAGAGAANADADFEFTRIGGDNRYATAALVADEYMTASTDEVILVNGEAGYFADALTANYLSGSRNAPILLTRDEFMPDATQDQLDEMDPAKVTIVGGEGVVPQEQADALEAAGYTVERIAGDDRFQTNAEVLEAVGATTRDTGIVATGWDFADALGAGPAVYQDRPLGLTKEDDIDDDVVQGLKDSGVTKIIVLGGPDVVGPEVVAELETAGFDVERIFGDDRSGTSAEFADYAIAEFGFTDTAADVASGYTLGSGADALAGGPLTGERNRPMLITKSARSAGDLPAWFEANAETLTEGVIYGLYGAVSAAIEDELEAAARTVTSNQDYVVTGAEAATNTVSDTDAPNRGARQYSVSGLADGTYDVRLFPAENVTVDANGVVSFVDDDGTAGAGNNEADIDEAEVDAVITVINGTNAGDVVHDEAAASNGSITFTVNSDTPDSVVPVVWMDSEDDQTVELDANNQPTEDFGVGGQKTWVPEEASAGVIGTSAADNQEVESVNKAGDSFITDTALYEYDANDVFYVSSDATFAETERVVLADFEAELSVGDTLDYRTDYESNEAFSSTFYLIDDAPAAPATVDAELQEDGRTVEVTFAESTDAGVDSYNVYRYEVSEANEELLRDTDAGNDPACTADIDDYTLLGSVADNNPATDEFVYTDESTEFDEAYCYAVTAVDNGEESELTEDAVAVVTDVEARETVAPTLVDTRVTTDQGTPGVLDAATTGDTDTTGDVVRIRFSEAMDATALEAGDQIRITDPQGEIFRITVATADTAATGEATIAWADYTPTGSTTAITNGQLTITLVDAPAKVGGTTPVAGAGVAELPADITAYTPDSLQDVAGNDADLANSADRTIDDEL